MEEKKEDEIASLRLLRRLPGLAMTMRVEAKTTLIEQNHDSYYKYVKGATQKSRLSFCTGELLFCKLL